MRYTKILLIMLLSAGAVVDSQAAGIPAEAESLVGQAFPGSEIISTTNGCDKQLTGAVVAAADQSLHAIVFTQDADGHFTKWEVSRSVDYSKGGVSDFLDDYTAQSKPEVRCTDPATDPDINQGSDGKYVISDKRICKSKLVCFSASDVYNSWACFAPVGDYPVQLVFLQLNAD